MDEWPTNDEAHDKALKALMLGDWYQDVLEDEAKVVDLFARN